MSVQYLYSEVSNLSDWDDAAWNRCLEESWSSLNNSMDWDAFAKVFYNDNSVSASGYTDRQKKDWLRQDLRNAIGNPNFKVLCSYRNGYIIKFMKIRYTEESEGGNRMEFVFLVVGRDDNGSKRFVVTEVPIQIKAFRKLARSFGVRKVNIHVCNLANASMKRYWETHYKVRSTFESEETSDNPNDDSIKSNHTLPDDDTDLEG